MNSKQGIGLGLAIVGVIFLLGIIQIPYCFGQTVSTPSFLFWQGQTYCVGLAVNLGFWLGLALAIVGGLLLYQAYSEDE